MPPSIQAKLSNCCSLRVESFKDPLDPCIQCLFFLVLVAHFRHFPAFPLIPPWAASPRQLIHLPQPSCSFVNDLILQLSHFGSEAAKDEERYNL